MLPSSDQAILDFEAANPGRDGQKEEAIRQTFALSNARYYQRLNQIIDTPAAIATEPMLVKRLQRQRSERLKARRSRSFVA